MNKYFKVVICLCLIAFVGCEADTLHSDLVSGDETGNTEGGSQSGTAGGSQSGTAGGGQSGTAGGGQSGTAGGGQSGTEGGGQSGTESGGQSGTAGGGQSGTEGGGQSGTEGGGEEQGDPELDPSIPRDVVGGLYSDYEDATCFDSEALECAGNYVLQCKNSHYYINDICDPSSTDMCMENFGCVSCNPGEAYCENNSVYQCSDDGKKAIEIKSCGISVCSAGACQNDNCPEDAQFIYLVDSSYNLIKFNPGAKDGKYLSVLFSLNCTNSSTPFSMAVDRDANAWVLYQDSTLYKVSISDHSCSYITNMSGNGSGLTKFGMAFSLDNVGGTTDTLYIGNTTTSGNFGRINTDTMQYTPLAKFPYIYENTPELTGTGLAKLYAFSPGQNTQVVSEIDKSSGESLVNYTLPGAGGTINAWAFAHWGGDFFIFETVSNINKILRFNIQSNTASVFLDNTSYRVVGAGVSTCAPVEEIL